MKSDSGRWNRENPDRVQEARERYKKKQAEERARRSALTPLERAQEDLQALLAPLSDDDCQALLEWLIQEIEGRSS